MDLLFSGLGIDELVYILHRTGTIQGVQGYQIGDRCGLGFPQDLLHPLTLKLKDAGTTAVTEKSKGLGIIFRDLSDIQIHPSPFEKLDGVLDDGEGLETQKVHLHQAAVFQIVHGVLGRYGQSLWIPI
ncbi:hypothetical protein ES708_31019 [subsurface metagenome]